MADASHTQQYTKTVSIPREGLASLSQDGDLNKNELRVILALFTRLNGFNRITPGGNVRKSEHDPNNYIEIDKEALARDLDLKKKEIGKCIKNLEEYGILEKGTNEVSGKGWRFTF